MRPLDHLVQSPHTLHDAGFFFLPTSNTRVARLCEAIVVTSSEVLQAIRHYPQFAEVGVRMLRAWNDGMNSLRIQKTWLLPNLNEKLSGESLTTVTNPKAPWRAMGRSPLTLMS